ncbi:MAG: hypothetical protein SGPRY_014908, partial [Prymnesium sp.]
FKAHVVNKLGTAYDKAAPGGCPPSGKQRENVIYWNMVYVWESAKLLRWCGLRSLLKGSII